MVYYMYIYQILKKYIQKFSVKDHNMLESCKIIFINMSWCEDINSDNVFRIPTVMFFFVQRIQFTHLLLWNLEWENVYVLLYMLRVARLWKDTCQVKKLKYTNCGRYERRIQYNIIEFQGIKNLCYKHRRPMGHLAHLILSNSSQQLHL